MNFKNYRENTSRRENTEQRVLTHRLIYILSVADSSTRAVIWDGSSRGCTYAIMGWPLNKPSSGFPLHLISPVRHTVVKPERQERAPANFSTQIFRNTHRYDRGDLQH